MTACRKISRTEFDQWCTEGKCLDPKHGFPAVILHSDDTVTKVWARPQRLLSSSRWRPYATRFVDNARRLGELGIKVPEILDYGRLEGSHVRIVRYCSLPGTSIRELLKTDPGQVDVPSLNATATPVIFS